MKDWEKFTAIGAIGPDLFYFSQDYNSLPLGPTSDVIMLSLAIYYYFDAAKEDDWEPLLIILDGVNSTIASLLRLLIKLQKIWQAFVEGWNQTIGPIISQINNTADALTGGLLSEAGVVIEELKIALKTIAEEELLTFQDIFSNFNTCVQKGFGENLFLWSDMSHYRRPSALCQAFVDQVDKLAARGMVEESRQFLAFTLGYITHLGTDTIAHAFVNEQCGGPFRNHPQRHHLIENHVDAWNYAQTAPGNRNLPDPWGYTKDYPEVSMSALWYAVQLTPEDEKNPQGKQRPSPLPDDPVARKKAIDVDGTMPGWMAEAIVKALIATFGKEPHPLIFQGSKFQSTVDQGLLSTLIEAVTGSGSDKPFPELLAGIAPKPSFDVPVGFPLPWQMQTIYKIMITFYKFSFTGTWEMSKPRKPDFIIFPPVSDFQNLFQPPDLSGIDPSNPIDDVCGLFVALVDWAIKSLEAAGQLVEDLIKMLASPGTYLLRLGLYQLGMIVWDIVTKTHEILAHTAFFSPHSLQTYPDGELRLPDEIDIPLITLGGTVDGAFRAALAAAFDPLGNLDQNQDVIGDSHSVSDPRYPYYPVRSYAGPGLNDKGKGEGFEFHRPWAYPTTSVFGPNHNAVDTPTEIYDPRSGFAAPPDPASPDSPPSTYAPLRPGPFIAGAMPDVFFDLSQTGDPATRTRYEHSQTPWETDELNALHLLPRTLGVSPLGTPIPFSAYLIGQLVNPTGYSTQFNLDSDRSFAYLTWDWIRGSDKKTGIPGLEYAVPVEPPPDADGWAKGDSKHPLKLKYVDAPDRLRARPTVGTQGRRQPRSASRGQGNG